jgi:hypothetical protein
MTATPLNLKSDSEEAPIIRLAHQLVKDAVKLRADKIMLELDVELHAKTHEELKRLNEEIAKSGKTLQIGGEFFFKLMHLPDAVRISYMTNGIPSQLPSMNGELFGNIVSILLQACGIAPWTKGNVSARLETVNPVSKWILESKDVTRELQLRRIRANE